MSAVLPKSEIDAGRRHVEWAKCGYPARQSIKERGRRDPPNRMASNGLGTRRWRQRAHDRRVGRGQCRPRGDDIRYAAVVDDLSAANVLSRIAASRHLSEHASGRHAWLPPPPAPALIWTGAGRRDMGRMSCAAETETCLLTRGGGGTPRRCAGQRSEQSRPLLAVSSPMSFLRLAVYW
jgi:hypothetical protein